MRVDPERAKILAENLRDVYQRVQNVAGGRKVRIIAVSKLKPATDILALHRFSDPPQLDFGENYAQELTEKSRLLPRTIRWHMIGALQTNKCRPLAEQVPNLFCVGSVDAAKKADALEKGRAVVAAGMAQKNQKLRVLVQVNTSGEEGKSGVPPSEAAALCRHIVEKCPHLRLGGLMTIGALARSRAVQQAEGEEMDNEDFVVLKETRERVVRELDGLVGEGDLELSMGMSADFEAAVRQGSDEVRVGTKVFGERPAKGERR
ncbi:hypothetical protein M433DRAFT_72191 [Acidomyces richmondensis BFW]|nr:hypothetical protein M433DRAFT_72191 [Acidomyces richmondensis BFW]